MNGWVTNVPDSLEKGKEGTLQEAEERKCSESVT